MNKKQGIVTIATLGVLAVATASPASAHHGQRQESNDRTTRISAAATTTPAVALTAEQQVYLTYPVTRIESMGFSARNKSRQKT
jgi:hypothetical protein